MRQNINPPGAGVRKTVLGGSFGMFLEFYEYGIYGFFAPVLAKVFFTGDGVVGLLLTYGIFAVTFLFRPIGGVVLGAIGDRYGRKTALLISLTIITLATTIIGLIPSYAAIGIAAPIVLTICRLAQGFSAGGEVAAAVTLIGETAPPKKRAFFVSFVQIASFIALLTGTVMGLFLSNILSPEAFQSWGWRIPFLLALPLGIIGLWIRRHVPESEAFETGRHGSRDKVNPLKAAFSTAENRRYIALALFIPLLNNIGYYVLFNYLPTYLKNMTGLTPGQTFAITSVGLLTTIIAIPFAAALADRIGRKPVLITSSLTMALAVYPGYLAMQTGGLGTAFASIMVLALIFAGNTGVIHTVLMEIFPPSVRMTSYSLGYNVGLALFGGGGPLLVTYLISKTGNPGIPAFYIIIASVATAAFVAMIRETSPAKRDNKEKLAGS